ncbi:hypothetical protein SO802_018005 [Lithocarpus litseifolius]|uniref:Uncharacterized protein n=1 Tax=Lithocarpus litseifolius TaxID=425828 RepID=A0AAW2CLY3_9ROSI
MEFQRNAIDVVENNDEGEKNENVIDVDGDNDEREDIENVTFVESAKIKFTQRSESTNNVFHRIMKTSMPLIQVIEFYEENVTQMCQDKTNEDLYCKNGVPTKVNRYGVASYNEVTKFVKKKMSEVTWKAEQMIMTEENVGKESHQKDLTNDNGLQTCLVGDKPILNPPHVRENGITNKRVKVNWKRERNKESNNLSHSTS